MNFSLYSQLAGSLGSVQLKGIRLRSLKSSFVSSCPSTPSVVCSYLLLFFGEVGSNFA